MYRFHCDIMYAWASNELPKRTFSMHASHARTDGKYAHTHIASQRDSQDIIPMDCVRAFERMAFESSEHKTRAPYSMQFTHTHTRTQPPLAPPQTTCAVSEIHSTRARERDAQCNSWMRFWYFFKFNLTSVEYSCHGMKCTYLHLKKLECSTQRLRERDVVMSRFCILSQRPAARCRNRSVDPVFRRQRIPSVVLQFPSSGTGANIIWLNHIVDGKNTARVWTKHRNERTRTHAPPR